MNNHPGLLFLIFVVIVACIIAKGWWQFEFSLPMITIGWERN